MFSINGTSAETNGTRIGLGSGGFQEARGNGGSGGGPFYLSHRKELLSSPGEWFHDAQTNELFIVTAGPDTPPPATGLVAPVVAELVRIEGTKDRPAENIRLSSLVFRHAAPTFMRPAAVPSGGDYSVYKGGALTFSGSVNCSVDHSLFDAVG